MINDWGDLPLCHDVLPPTLQVAIRRYHGPTRTHGPSHAQLAPPVATSTHQPFRLRLGSDGTPTERGQARVPQYRQIHTGILHYYYRKRVFMTAGPHRSSPHRGQLV